MKIACRHRYPVGRRPAGRAAALVASLLALAVAAPTLARAQNAPETLYNVFSLSIAADTEIANDLMRATLVVQAEAKEPAALADEINATMRWALDALGAFEAITPETRDYRTYPRYDSSQTRRLIGWRGSQTLVLESNDFEAMSRAIQSLQERLQVQGTTLSVKRETRREATDALIEQALQAFRRRALLIQENLGAPGYRILEANVQSEESFGGAPLMQARGMSMQSESRDVSEPALAAGTSRVTVQVHGRIQLEN